jgi:heparanase
MNVDERYGFIRLAAAVTRAGTMRKKAHIVSITLNAILLTGLTNFAANAQLSAPPIHPKTLPRIGTVDQRFQSYNIEMVEVTGGRFWKPYDSAANAEPQNAAHAAKQSGNQPAGMAASLYEYRPPIDLSNPRLRKLAAALGPAYLRVSGTWANTTWFQDSDGPAPSAPPAGFRGVLTRQQWKGVIDFANAVGAKIVTSFAVSSGARDAQGVWSPEQARALLDFTKASGGSIAAAEFMNEPTVPEIGGAPKGYDAAAFARDFAVFRAFMKQASPETLLLGPGGVGEGSGLMPASMHILKSEDILAATGPVFDAFSDHFYGTVSARCGRPGMPGTISPDQALSAEWLGRAVKSEEYYAAIRDRFEPGKPIWLTETAEAACGGDRFASTFRDSFRYLNQLGALARRGVQVHMHNTLAASDYGLLDEKTYEPRPNYWAALLWRRLMSATVLDAGTAATSDLHTYAHCLPKTSGGVTLLVINTDTKNDQKLEIAKVSDRYTLTARDLSDRQVLLNGVDLALGGNNASPSLTAVKTPAGKVTFPPASITFLAFPKAGNANCRP